MRTDALERLRQATTEAGADALLISSAPNVRYLSGFSTPADGWVLLTEAAATLVTDGRYTAQAAEESRLPVEVLPLQGERLVNLAALVKGKRLAAEAHDMTLKTASILEEQLGSKLIPTSDLVADLRTIKTSAELGALRAAAKLTDEAFAHILNHLAPGQSETDIALELERYLRLNGAERIAFDITVASGKRSAMPHGTASQKRLAEGELVTLDFGAVVNGYHADMTRTVALGEVSDQHAQLYQAVLEAQEAALTAAAPGKDGKAVDAVARSVLESHGLAEAFSHSLGHGVGLAIHEAPRLSPNVSVTLQPGMAVTIEPGAYLPGDAGVRIEDLVVITEAGAERLSHSDKAFLKL